MQERFFVKTEISIGELSRRTGCKVESVRYYERIGLLPKARREGGRFRRYDANDVARLRFIRRARQLGFTLDEVHELLRLTAGDGENVRAEARSLAPAHVAGIREKRLTGDGGGAIESDRSKCCRAAPVYRAVRPKTRSLHVN